MATEKGILNLNLLRAVCFLMKTAQTVQRTSQPEREKGCHRRTRRTECLPSCLSRNSASGCHRTESEIPLLLGPEMAQERNHRCHVTKLEKDRHTESDIRIRIRSGPAVIRIGRKNRPQRKRCPTLPRQQERRRRESTFASVSSTQRPVSGPAPCV